MHMMKTLKLLVAAIALGITPGMLAQTIKTIYVPKGGALAQMVPQAEANEITHLKLNGKINAIDFRMLRDSFPKLRMLDISQASIGFYAGKKGTGTRFQTYPANNIPEYAFCTGAADSTFSGKETLRRIILPNDIKGIGRGAFRGCSNLRTCQITKTEPPTLHEDALADTLTAIYVPAGSSDKYRNKKGWENFSIIEGEATNVRVRMPRAGSLARELSKQGVQPKDINSLKIDGELNDEDFILIRNYMPNLVSIDLHDCKATAIPPYAFTQKKYLLTIRLPQGLKTIGQRAFSGCTRLCGTLMLPPTVTAIEYGAFIGCDRLRQVVATGDKITTIGDKLFGKKESRLVYKPAI